MVDRTRAWAWVVLMGLACTTGALGQDKPLAGKDLLYWNANWSRVAKHYVPIGNEFYACVTYSRSYPSSLHQTVASWVNKNTEIRKEKIGSNISKNVRYAPPKAEGAAAAAAIPSLSPGLYGHIHSAQIEQVVGPGKMIVNAIWFIDQKETFDLKNAEQKKLNKYLWEERQRMLAQQKQNKNRSRNKNIQNIRRINTEQLQKQLDDKFKIREQRIKDQGELRNTRVLLVGFPTGGVVKGTRWSGSTLSPYGPQIAVTGEMTEAGYDPKSYIGRRKKLVVAINADLFKKNRIDEESFKRLLKQRNLTPAQFVELAKTVFATVREQARSGEPNDSGIKFDSNNPHPHLVLALEALKGGVTEPDPTVAEGPKTEEEPAKPDPAKDVPKIKPDVAKWFGAKDTPKPKPGTPTDPPANNPTGKTGEATQTTTAPAGTGSTESKPAKSGVDWFKSKKTN